jgi:CPA2 family monovalent cation:H+ antiporter-2
VDDHQAKPEFVVVVGFGVPGRAIAELLHAQRINYCVIERNVETVARCEKGGEHIMTGDATDPQVLRSAGIERATMVAIAVPDEKSALAITKEVHRLNPNTKILTRCHYISAGFQAKAAGAVEVIVAEEVVAMAFTHLVGQMLGDAPAASTTAPTDGTAEPRR